MIVISSRQSAIPIGQYLGKTQSIYGLNFHNECRKYHHMLSYWLVIFTFDSEFELTGLEAVEG